MIDEIVDEEIEIEAETPQAALWAAMTMKLKEAAYSVRIMQSGEFRVSYHMRGGTKKDQDPRWIVKFEEKHQHGKTIRVRVKLRKKNV